MNYVEQIVSESLSGTFTFKNPTAHHSIKPTIHSLISSTNHCSGLEGTHPKAQTVQDSGASELGGVSSQGAEDCLKQVLLGVHAHRPQACQCPSKVHL